MELKKKEKTRGREEGGREDKRKEGEREAMTLQLLNFKPSLAFLFKRTLETYFVAVALFCILHLSLSPPGLK